MTNLGPSIGARYECESHIGTYLAGLSDNQSNTTFMGTSIQCVYYYLQRNSRNDSIYSY